MCVFMFLCLCAMPHIARGAIEHRDCNCRLNAQWGRPWWGIGIVIMNHSISIKNENEKGYLPPRFCDGPSMSMFFSMGLPPSMSLSCDGCVLVAFCACVLSPQTSINLCNNGYCLLPCGCGSDRTRRVSFRQHRVHRDQHQQHTALGSPLTGFVPSPIKLNANQLPATL